MRAIVTLQNGSCAGRKLWLKVGQRMTFGRTDRADFAVADDGLLSGLHFELECLPAGARLRDLNSANGTFIAGQRVVETVLQGGEEIQAGNTLFLVEFDETLRTSVAPSNLNLSDPARDFVTESFDWSTAGPSPGQPTQPPNDPFGTLPPAATRSVELGSQPMLEICGRETTTRQVLSYGQHLTVGRTNAAEICVPDDPLMSGLHFGFSVKRKQVEIEDLRSTNGTFIDGERIRQGNVTGVEVVQAGSTKFHFYLPVEESTPPQTQVVAASEDLRGTLPTPLDPTNEPLQFASPTASIANEERSSADAMHDARLSLPHDDELALGDEIAPPATEDVKSWSASQPERVTDDGHSARNNQTVDGPAPQSVDTPPIELGEDETYFERVSDVAETFPPVPTPLDAIADGEPIQAEGDAGSLPNGGPAAQPKPTSDGSPLEIVIVDVVLDGGEVRKLWLTPGQTIIVGHASDADEILELVDGFSARHFVLIAESAGCTVRDLESATGTSVNGQRVANATLDNGDTIQAGNYLFHVALIRKSE
ncbi:MAG: FHA domain-containing protein [Planctomycetales bacterium]|nr:FHA domain-containing protein [Planctomycetales bacterium]